MGPGGGALAGGEHAGRGEDWGFDPGTAAGAGGDWQLGLAGGVEETGGKGG